MNLSFEFEGLSDLLPDFDEVGLAMVEEAGPVLVEQMKEKVQRVVKHEGDSKGESKTKTYRHSKTKRGHYKVSNALKAIWKEYGIPSRDIPAQPFLEQTLKAAETEALDKMQKVFDDKVTT